MHIDSYSFGSMTIDGKIYESDLIIFPDRVNSGWWRKEGHCLTVDDLSEVIDYKPEILIVGKGASGCMRVPPSTKKSMSERQIDLLDKNTDQAYQLFNQQEKKGKRVVGAFHLTC